MQRRKNVIDLSEILEQCRPIGVVDSFEELDRILINAFLGRYPFELT
jgi:hypothetical protein